MRRRKRRIKRGTHVSTKTGLSCKYRSGWELRYMEYLDNDPNTLDYRYEPFAIPYVSNKKTGKIRRYYPDILVKTIDGRQKLIEIKPVRRLNQRANVKKILAAHEWCKVNGIEFMIITEIELKALNLL